LPLAFNVSSDLYESGKYVNDPFVNQENFISHALGQDVSFFFEPEYENGVMQDDRQNIVVHIRQDGPLYFYTDPIDCHDSSNGKKCELYLNGELVQRICSRFYTNVVYLGDYSAGDTVNLTIK